MYLERLSPTSRNYHDEKFLRECFLEIRVKYQFEMTASVQVNHTWTEKALTDFCNHIWDNSAIDGKANNYDKWMPSFLTKGGAIISGHDSQKGRELFAEVNCDFAEPMMLVLARTIFFNFIFHFVIQCPECLFGAFHESLASGVLLS